MEDMKKMIERYKRELLEYSKSSGKPVSEKPKETEKPDLSDLSELSELTKLTEVSEKGETKKPAGKPQVIGYVSEDARGELAKMNVPEEIVESITAPDTAVPQTEDNETVTYDFPDENENESPQESESSQENAPAEESEAQGNIAPGYTENPSFSDTRGQITEDSKPNENVATENTSGVTDNSANVPRAEYGNNATVSEEQAERLTQQPISGTSIDEQLTGRSFEDERIPQNDPNDVMEQNGSRSDISNFPMPSYDNLEEFERNNRGSGTIVFRVYTAREALPVENAVCKVTKIFNGDVHTFYTLVTDESGKTPARPLPAPSKELSQQSENLIQPFSLYDALVTREGYADVELKEIPVFDGVSSVQQVSMIPAPRMNITGEENTNAR